MNRSFSLRLRWIRRVVLGMLLAITSIGCGSPASLLWFLNRGDGKVPAEFKLEPVEGKKELDVAILVTCSPALVTTSAENASLDRELTTNLTQILVSETKDSKMPIRVMDQGKMMAFKQGNMALWETGNRNELAKKLGVDYLLEVYVNNFTMDSRQYGGEITQGRASSSVAVYRAGKSTNALHSYQRTFNPPFRDTRSMNASHYRTNFIHQMAMDIAHMHIDYAPDYDRPMSN